jgi:hypothetical protein
MASERGVAVPASTAAPLVLAVGITLLLAGLVTNPSASVVGGALMLAGVVGWFRQVLPHERHAEAALEPAPRAIEPSPHRVERFAHGTQHRAHLPVTYYPYAAGLRGGIAGGVAMAAVAVLYGVLGHDSLWYTVNLLAAAASAPLSDASTETLKAFSTHGFVLALILHAVFSLLVGLLYGVLLPMVPGHPALWGGLVAPILWSGLLAIALPILDPALSERVSWPWFVASQIAFGLVAGLVVVRAHPIPTSQRNEALIERVGLETQDDR